MALFIQPFNFLSSSPVIELKLQQFNDLLYTDLNSVIAATVASGTANRLAYYTSSTAIGALSAITASRALQSNASGLPEASSVTTTELGYLSGVTSAIQTQLNSKANTALSNLASVAINTSLISDTTDTDDLGSSAVRWSIGYFARHVNVSSSLSGGATALTSSNTSNTASSNAGVSAIVAGTSAGDPFFTAGVTGATDYTWGIDNSDGDAWVLSNATSLGSSNRLRLDTTSFQFGLPIQSDTDDTDDIGTSSIGWRNLFLSQAINNSAVNLAIGSTKNSASTAFDTDYFIIQVGVRGILGVAKSSVGTSELFLTNNYYFDGTNDKRLNTDVPIWYVQDSNGNHRFYAGTAGSAGSTFTASLLAQISPAGEVTQPLQPSFLVTNSAGATDVTGDGTVYAVPFATEVYDQGGDFASNTFTAPVDGRYLLTATILPQNFLTTHNDRNFNITTSNRVYNANRNYSLAETNNTMTVTVIADMDANDTATVNFSVSGSTKTIDLINNATLNFFSGSLIN